MVAFALYVGPIAGVTAPEGEPHVLIEANSDEGVVSAPLSKYKHYHTRICRPVGLSEADCEKVCRYASERIGLGYDLKNIIDLMRYLFPWPVTQRRRRWMIMLGSGDATMSYDLRVRSQAHYLLARSVVDFWTDTGFPISLKCLRRTPQSRFRGISSAVCDFFVSMA